MADKSEVKVRLTLDGEKAFVQGANGAADALDKIGPAVDKIAPAVNKVNPAVDSVSDAINKIPGLIDKIPGAVNRVRPAVDSALRPIVDAVNRVPSSRPGGGSSAPGLKAVEADVTALGAAADRTASLIDRMAASLSSLQAVAKRVADSVSAARTATDTLASASASVGKVAPKVKQDTQASAKSLEDIAPAAERASEALKRHAGAATASTGKVKAALAQLPMQMQDVAVSLHGGMNPFTVLMQQGSQVVGSFGSVGTALRATGGYVLGLVNPLTASAAAAAAAALAYNDGANEAQGYTRVLAMTGNQLGMTTDQFAEMAVRIDATIGTTSGASAALTTMAQAGVTNRESLQGLTEASIRWSEASGEGVDVVAKRFAQLEQDPLKASIKLHESTGFLTVSILRQIDALTDQGKTVEAAKVAQEAYAASIAKGADEINASLGSLERGWRSIKSAAASAWDAMLGIGRADTIDEQIKKAQADLKSLQSGRTGWFGESLGSNDDEIRATQARIAGLEATKKATEGSAAAKGKEASAVKEAAKAIEEENKAAAKKPRGAGQFNKLESAQVAMQRAIAEAQLKSEISNVNALRQVQERGYALGIISAQDYYREMRGLANEEAGFKIEAIGKEIVAEEARRTKGDADNIAKQARLVALRGQLADVQAQSAIKAAQISAQAEAAALGDERARAAEWAASWKSAAEAAMASEQDVSEAMAGLILDPLEQAQRRADSAADEIERRGAEMAASLRTQISILSGSGQNGMAAALQAQLDRLQAATAAKSQQTRAAPGEEFLGKYLQADIGKQLGDGFGQASQSLSALVQGMHSLVSVTNDYGKSKAAAGTDAVKLAAVERKNILAQVSSYGTLAAAAKGLLKEQTTGYKVLAGAEKAFRAVELASAIQVQGAKLGLWGMETAAKVMAVGTQAGAVAAGQEIENKAVIKGEVTRNTAKVPGVFMAFMSALGPWGMAAAGVAIAAVLGGAFRGGGGGGFAATNTGTGTVLGDKSAQSESLKNSIDLLKGVDTLTMRYSAQMLTSLQSIDSKIGGVSNVLLRNGDVLTGGGLGISEWMQKNVGDPLLNMIGIDSTKGLGESIINGLGLGGVLDTVQGWWGKQSQEINAAGVQINGRLADVIAGGGMSRFADVTTTKKSWFGLSKDTSTSTQTAGLDAAIAQQFGLLLSGYSTTLEAAGAMLGTSADKIDATLQNFVVDIGRVDLKGLTGDALVERLEAVFSAEGDKLAAAVLPGFERFTQVGEGYLETVIRVASGTEQAGQALRRLGIDAVSLADVANAQGDIAAELVRTSLVNTERTGTALSSVGAILSSLSGDAAELVSTYTSLVDVRRALVTLGLDSNAVTRDLIAGAGSLQDLTDGLSSYEETFMSTTQRITLGTSRMSTAFGALGVSVPQSADEFRALVSGVDGATTAGQELLGGLLALSGSFSDYLELIGRAEEAQRSASDISSERTDLETRLLELTGDTAAIRARELAKLDAGNQAMQLRIWALEDEQAAMEKLAGAGQSIIAFVNELRGVTGSEASAQALRATYQADLASARAGDAEASARLVADAKSLIDSIKSTATDPVALARETSRIAADLQSLPASIAYQQQQVAQSTIAAINAATTATTSDATVTAASEQAAALTRMSAQIDAVVTELQGVRAAAVAGASYAGRTAKTLENVTPDGDSIAVKAAT